jgi:hypothetical protein
MKEKERKGKKKKGNERKGKKRKGKERKGKERKGKERGYSNSHTIPQIRWKINFKTQRFSDGLL